MHLSECSVYMYSIVKEHIHLTKLKNNLERVGVEFPPEKEILWMDITSFVKFFKRSFIFSKLHKTVNSM